MQYRPWQLREQRGGERPIVTGEPRSRRAQLPLENRESMPENENLHILVTITHRQQP
jgi:hypothetical protein